MKIKRDSFFKSPGFLGAVVAVAVVATFFYGVGVAYRYSGVSTPGERCRALGGVYVWKAHTCFKPDAIIKVEP